MATFFLFTYSSSLWIHDTALLIIRGVNETLTVLPLGIIATFFTDSLITSLALFSAVGGLFSLAYFSFTYCIIIIPFSVFL